YLRASGAALTFPFFTAFVIVEVVQRIGAAIPARIWTLDPDRAVAATGNEWSVFSTGVDSVLAGVVVLAIGVGAYLYFGPDQVAIAQRWEPITSEGTQVAALG